MKYALGPVLWYWPTEKLDAFYQQAASSTADIIYLGEAVCSKRRATSFGQWMELARPLATAGKQVVLSTLSLLQSPSELKELKRYISNGEFMIEASNMGTVNLAAEHGLPFVAGHALNIYNAPALKILLRQGMIRWCMPVELSRDWLSELLKACEDAGFRDQFEVEVFGYGYLPLALSARCFTARSENRDKDHCETCCIRYPQGRKVLSQEGQQVFVLNGIQTMSGYCYHLGNAQKGMHGLVDVFRVSPSDLQTPALIRQLRNNQNGEAPFDLVPIDHCNGYWRNIEGMALDNPPGAQSA